MLKVLTGLILEHEGKGVIFLRRAIKSQKRTKYEKTGQE